MNTAIENLIGVIVLLVAVLPAVVGAIREGGVNRQLRAAEKGRDPRSGVLVVFDLGFGPQENRARFAKANQERELAS